MLDALEPQRSQNLAPSRNGVLHLGQSIRQPSYRGAGPVLLSISDSQKPRLPRSDAGRQPFPYHQCRGSSHIQDSPAAVAYQARSVPAQATPRHRSHVYVAGLALPVVEVSRDSGGRRTARCAVLRTLLHDVAAMSDEEELRRKSGSAPKEHSRGEAETGTGSARVSGVDFVTGRDRQSARRPSSCIPCTAGTP